MLMRNVLQIEVMILAQDLRVPVNPPHICHLSISPSLSLKKARLLDLMDQFVRSISTPYVLKRIILEHYNQCLGQAEVPDH